MWEFFILISLPLAILVHAVIPAIQNHNAHKEERAKYKRKMDEYVEHWTKRYMDEGMGKREARKRAEDDWHRGFHA